MHPTRQRVRDVLADNLRAARAGSRLHQEEVATRMRSLGFDTWSRATVSEIERRRRAVTAEELVALVIVLEADVETLMRPGPRTPKPGIVDTEEYRERVALYAVEQALRGRAVFDVRWDANGIVELQTSDE